MSTDFQSVSMQDAAGVCALLDAASARMTADPLRRGSSIHLPAQGRILLTGDLHDNPVHFRLVQQLARLDRSRLTHLVAAHLSERTNHPDLVARCLESTLDGTRWEIARQDAVVPWFEVG